MPHCLSIEHPVGSSIAIQYPTTTLIDNAFNGSFSIDTCVSMNGGGDGGLFRQSLGSIRDAHLVKLTLQLQTTLHVSNDDLIN